MGGRVGGPVGRATFRLTMAALLAVPVAVVAAGPAAASPPSTLFSSTTAGTYSVQVPAGVTSVSITAVGGQGGPSFPGTSSAPGEAAIVSAAVSVNPGDTLTITVAGNGAEAASPGFGNPGSGAGSGGFGDKELGGGGGGGGSAVFDGSAALVVAGGGGGAAQGANGGGAGQDGNDPGGLDRGGHAGTQTGPGEPGSGCPLGASAGSGMNGGDGNSGGGGGGFFGGAGGCGNAGGGGGSSFPAADVTGLDPTGTPSVVITYVVPAVSIATSQQPASATVGSQFADSATVTGGSDPTGTITFNLYNNPNGTGTPLFTDTEPLTGGVATSASYTATATGTDYWVATYNGDSVNSAVSTGSGGEPVTITKATPSISTSQQPATATSGSQIADQATVSGGYNPTGTVTFNLYNNPNGTGTPLFTDTEPLADGVATSNGYTATSTGTDYWAATYNGDANNSSATSAASSEPVTITTASKLADLSVAISGPSSAADGSSFSEQITVKNVGPANAGNVVTAVLTPFGATVKSLGGGKVLFGLVFWTAPQINAGTSVTYTITFTVAAHAKGTTLIPAVTASMVNPDPSRANNWAITSVTLGR